MNLEQLAFLNHQLAGMLRSGIPLEGALRQLCGDMEHGLLRDELLALEGELARGVPIDQALSRRKLPGFYVQLVRLGARSNDLPGILTTAADYYSRLHALWTRLKGIMVYPVLVLLLALGVSLFVVLLARSVLAASGEGLELRLNTSLFLLPWFTPAFLILLLTGAAIGLTNSAFRNSLRWRLPAFREATLSQLAASLAVLLRGGSTLRDALSLVENLEADPRARQELARWQDRMAAGQGRFADLAGEGGRIPGLFVWLVASAGEDVVAGLGRAADLYYSRAVYKSEMLLYTALPVSILVLGLMVVGQILPMAQIWIQFMQSVSEPVGLLWW